MLGDLNRRLDELGLAFENLGDIDRQTLAGSISTGTHGTGARFRSLSAQVEAVELVLADGSSLEISADSDDRPRSLRARIGLGALGVDLRGDAPHRPGFTLNRVDRPRPLDDVLGDLDELNAGQRPLRVLRLPPHRDRALPREPAHRRAAAAAPGGARLRPGGGARELGRRRASRSPRAACPPQRPADRPAAVAGHRPLDQARPQLQGLRLRAPDQVHRDGVRDPARARRRGGAPGARARRAARARGRLPDRGPLRRRATT